MAAVVARVRDDCDDYMAEKIINYVFFVNVQVGEKMDTVSGVQFRD